LGTVVDSGSESNVGLSTIGLKVFLISTLGAIISGSFSDSLAFFSSVNFGVTGFFSMFLTGSAGIFSTRLTGGTDLAFDVYSGLSV